MICWKCKKEIKIESVYRTSECPLCAADLHCCKGCKFYSAGSHFECKENIEELVKDKEKANFCDFFMVKKDIVAGSSDSGESKAEAAKKAFNSLFGD